MTDIQKQKDGLYRLDFCIRIYEQLQEVKMRITEAEENPTTSKGTESLQDQNFQSYRTKVFRKAENKLLKEIEHSLTFVTANEES
jgi:hypothetical protein